MEFWVTPCNPLKYDVEGAFRDLHEIYWRQSNSAKSIEVNDYVYIYISGKNARIKYKCVVLRSNLDYDKKMDFDNKYYKADLGKAKKYMLLKLEKTIVNDCLSLDKLKLNGLKGTIQGPRRLKGSLYNYIEQCTKKSED